MKVLLAGVGNMGSAMVKAWLRNSSLDPSCLTLFDTDPRKLEMTGIDSVADEINARIASADLIFLAMKPQDLDSAAESLLSKIDQNSVIVSILAGVSMARLKQAFPRNSKIIRAMPNIAARICQAITAYVCSEQLSGEEEVQVQKLLAALGPVEKLQSEEMMDAWCAVAGSGPGFVAALMESFVSAACSLGFPAELADRMVKQTFYGTVQLAKDANFSLSDLRESVTSKGGTTSAGLEIYEKQKVHQAISEMIRSAEKRGKELNSKAI